MQLVDVFYALKHPKRALDFIMKERKIAKLCNCSMKEVRDSFKELNKSKLLTMLRLELKKFNFPLGTMLTPLRAPIVYATVRILKPSIVVETGVASGVSTTLILQALSLNGKGQLYSIDILTSTHLLDCQKDSNLDGLSRSILSKDGPTS